MNRAWTALLVVYAIILVGSVAYYPTFDKVPDMLPSSRELEATTLHRDPVWPDTCPSFPPVSWAGGWVVPTQPSNP